MACFFNLILFCPITVCQPSPTSSPHGSSAEPHPFRGSRSVPPSSLLISNPRRPFPTPQEPSLPRIYAPTAPLLPPRKLVNTAANSCTKTFLSSGAHLNLGIPPPKHSTRCGERSVSIASLRPRELEVADHFYS
ncbi:hypothetical protein B0T10DRAFT_268276 [Thelonectria olida]|uniref:Uncharacterized protein n=1 Tax=Thelonectria olida TaxID=1576542 RepID=A0A9P8WBF3_9HYPO|nr:hypothetical protein B0T10DRAFT_268276 [Thelonectria olida]